MSAARTSAAAATGVLGGTFDPVHHAHLRIAALALEKLPLGRVLWLPTGAPKYRAAPVASGEHRVAMLELALAAQPRYEIDTRELAPGHSGYTVETLEALRAELGGAAGLVLLMGGDQYARLDSWHRPDEIRKLARIAVFDRPGWQPPDRRATHIPMDPLPVSASGIRARVARGEDIAGLVPAPVAAYIAAHGLYR